jgi:hypothetical protein
MDLQKITDVTDAALAHCEKIGLDPELLDVVWDPNPPQFDSSARFLLPSPQTAKTWEAKFSEGKIHINAFALDPANTGPHINHELGHALYKNPNLKDLLHELYESLPASTRRKLAKTLTPNYPKEHAKEEQTLQALDLIQASAPKSLWEKFLEALEAAWNILTNSKSISPTCQRTLAAELISQTAFSLSHSHSLRKNGGAYELLP